jgi:hypothetical protein
LSEILRGGMGENGDARDAVDRKIADPQLRALARAHSGESVSVIVELNVPHGEVEIEAGQEGGVGAWRPTRVRPPSESEMALGREITDEAHALLERLSGSPPVSLGAAAFGARLPSLALDALAASPLVRRISVSQLRR